MRLYSYELFAVSDFQGDVHVRPFPVNVFGIERLLVPAFEKVAFAANLTSSSSVATRHNPNKFGFCSHCSIGSQLCRHFHSCKTKCKRSSLVDVSIPGATIIRILLQRGGRGGGLRLSPEDCSRRFPCAQPSDAAKLFISPASSLHRCGKSFAGSCRRRCRCSHR